MGTFICGRCGAQVELMSVRRHMEKCDRSDVARQAEERFPTIECPHCATVNDVKHEHGSGVCWFCHKEIRWR